MLGPLFLLPAFLTGVIVHVERDAALVLTTASTADKPHVKTVTLRNIARKVQQVRSAAGMVLDL